MTSWLRGSAVVLILGGLSLAVAFSLAQTTAKPPRPPAKPADAPAGSTTPTPSATFTPAPPKVQRSEVITAGNWTVTCAQTDPASAKRRCSAVLKISQNQNNAQRVVFTWLIGVQDSKTVSVVSIPPGILIGPGVFVKVGANEGRKFVYLLCQADHCEAVVPLDDALAKELAASPTAEVSVVAVNGSTVKFTVDPTGFEQALAEVTK